MWMQQARVPAATVTEIAESSEKQKTVRLLIRTCIQPITAMSQDTCPKPEKVSKTSISTPTVLRAATSWKVISSNAV